MRSAKGHNSRMLGVFFIALALIFLLAMPLADARFEKTREFIGKAKSGPFWVNAVVFFIAAFILYSMFANKLGNDSTQKTVLMIALGLLSLWFASMIVEDNGPVLFWKAEKLRDPTQFFFGPAEPANTGDCQGRGSYIINNHCRQAILLPNDARPGLGLPAFLAGWFVLYLILGVFLKNGLRFDETGKWVPITLTGLLAAMIANGGTSKNTLLCLGGWVIVFVLGNSIGKSLSNKEEAGISKAVGFALIFTLVQIILNMLGTTLWFARDIEPEMNSTNLFTNLLIGIIVGVVYWILTDPRMLKKIMSRSSSDAYAKEGNSMKAILSRLPIINLMFKHPVVKARAALMKNRSEQLIKLSKQMELALSKDVCDDYEIKRIERKIAEVEALLRNDNDNSFGIEEAEYERAA